MSVNYSNIEQELLNRIAEGDEAAFKELYDRSWNRLYAFAISWLKSGILAEDVVQDIFLKLWIRRAELSAIKNADNYLFILCRNAVLNLMEKNAVRQKSGNEIASALESPLLPDAVLQLKELKTTINQLVEKLPTQQRLVYKMSREEGLTHDEIAQRLGILKETVKNHMVRALNTLRKNADPGNTLALLFFWMLELTLKK
ncbi:RNA polymerase sigma-70 factor [Pseudobacter ginsenosidimutans]|uniref:RNA polymerase sigma-70 factor (ECF subfamily) n=1 Tax=Pseudobacter ginsenosidimutans TaxID=661488 RepID=A0A4Q7MSV8_9BACT|nr:RNA polymerase sigma-70 factor [Pseudobacter ginsenosidimutans]QEC41530.1 RNA polymerase sigma-70 factor [Pseudobacter ginsenosidimutans]RZS71687.1 RNA polymerase sigma-70 factor (ECF subfamily) [Pseudobacter ginsenosidimutans]